MALSDYHLCAVCENKVFYDAELGDNESYMRGVERSQVRALCDRCAKTYKLAVVPQSTNICDKKETPK